MTDSQPRVNLEDLRYRRKFNTRQVILWQRRSTDLVSAGLHSSKLRSDQFGCGCDMSEALRVFSPRLRRCVPADTTPSSCAYCGTRRAPAPCAAQSAHKTRKTQRHRERTAQSESPGYWNWFSIDSMRLISARASQEVTWLKTVVLQTQYVALWHHKILETSWLHTLLGVLSKFNEVYSKVNLLFFKCKILIHPYLSASSCTQGLLELVRTYRGKKVSLRY